MSMVSKTLARSKDSPIIFVAEKDIEEFLIEFGIAGQFNQKIRGANRIVQICPKLNHPTHYLLLIWNRDYISPIEDRNMLICIPKSTETVEGFMKSNRKTIEGVEGTVSKFWVPSSGQEKPSS